MITIHICLPVTACFELYSPELSRSTERLVRWGRDGYRTDKINGHEKNTGEKGKEIKVRKG
jgi:hypothetical protein